MTETEWLTATDSEQMLTFLGPRLSPRKRRLYGCACCRRRWEWVEGTQAAAAVEVAEAFADGGATKIALKHNNTEANQFAGKCFREWIGHQDFRQYIIHMHASACARTCDFADHIAQQADVYAAQTHARAMTGNAEMLGDEWEVALADEHAAFTALLRDITGNPFRLVSVCPEWRTDTALALAQQMYDLREFSAAPILADALQDAGCDSDDILNHLRDMSAQHVRGCWALDLVLGKE